MIIIYTLNAYPTWQSIKNLKTKNCHAVVIDVLRASNTIINALKNGAQDIIPVAEIDAAWKLKEKYPNYLLGGERKSLKIKGFNFGNSPLEYFKEKIENKSIIFTTSNGSRALKKAASAENIYVASLANSLAVTKKLNNHYTNIIIICAGTLGNPSLEDTLAAGKIISQLSNLNNYILNDYAYLALGSYHHFQGQIYKTILNSQNGRRLQELGCLNDINFCSQENITDIVPQYSHGKIYKK